MPSELSVPGISARKSLPESPLSTSLLGVSALDTPSLASPSNVNRGKQGLNRSTLTDATGLPLHLVSAGANRHDAPLLEPPLAGLETFAPLPADITAHLDRGDANSFTRTLWGGLAITGEIARKGIPAPLQVGNRTRYGLAQHPFFRLALRMPRQPRPINATSTGLSDWNNQARRSVRSQIGHTPPATAKRMVHRDINKMGRRQDGDRFRDEGEQAYYQTVLSHGTRVSFARVNRGAEASMCRVTIAISARLTRLEA